MKKIRVLCIDDSALIRKLLSEMLQGDPGIEVVGTAPDPLVARERIKRLNPDVITLDVEMPKMDGLTFLEKLMRLRPTPVVMVSTLTARGAEVALKALELGAVDVVGKPKEDLSKSFPALAEELRTKVRAAATARLTKGARSAKPTRVSGAATRRHRPAPAQSEIILIGASTGGTEATRELRATFPEDSPPVLIAQHIPASFSAPYAARLDKLTPLMASEGKDGESLQPGHAYVAPGDVHMQLARGAEGPVLRLSSAERVNRHRPSVDVLFESAAQTGGASRVTAVLLTGMGEDGARGLLRLRESGARTAAQDEITSVVWGMPGSAVRLGAAAQVLPLHNITDWIFGG